jgi:hypothetical protein
MFSDHPMEYVARREGRIDETVFLAISPDVLTAAGTLFTDGVANKTGVEPMNLATAADVLDWEVVCRRLDWRDPEVQDRLQVARKYEVLVPDEVPIHLITGL